MSDYLMNNGFQLPGAWSNHIKLAPKSSTNVTNPKMIRAVLCEALYAKIDADQGSDMRGQERLALLDFVLIHLMQCSRIVASLTKPGTNISREETSASVLKA